MLKTDVDDNIDKVFQGFLQINTCDHRKFCNGNLKLSSLSGKPCWRVTIYAAVQDVIASLTSFVLAGWCQENLEIIWMIKKMSR